MGCACSSRSSSLSRLSGVADESNHDAQIKSDSGESQVSSATIVSCAEQRRRAGGVNRAFLSRLSGRKETKSTRSEVKKRKTEEKKRKKTQEDPQTDGRKLQVIECKSTTSTAGETTTTTTTTGELRVGRCDDRSTPVRSSTPTSERAPGDRLAVEMGKSDRSSAKSTALAREEEEDDDEESQVMIFTSIQQLCCEIIEELVASESDRLSRSSSATSSSSSSSPPSGHRGIPMCLFLFGSRGSCKGEVAYELVEHSALVEFIGANRPATPEALKTPPPATLSPAPAPAPSSPSQNGIADEPISCRRRQRQRVGDDQLRWRDDKCPLYHYLDAAALISKHIDERIKEFKRLGERSARNNKRPNDLMLARPPADGCGISVAEELTGARRTSSGSGVSSSSEPAEAIAGVEEHTQVSAPLKDDEDHMATTTVKLTTGEDDNEEENDEDDDYVSLSPSSGSLVESSAGDHSHTTLEAKSEIVSHDLSFMDLNTRQRLALQVKLHRYANAITAKWIFELIQTQVDLLEQQVLTCWRLEQAASGQADKQQQLRDRVYLINLVPCQLALFQSCLYLQQEAFVREFRYPILGVKFERRTNIRLIGRDHKLDRKKSSARKPNAQRQDSSSWSLPRLFVGWRFPSAASCSQQKQVKAAAAAAAAGKGVKKQIKNDTTTSFDSLASELIAGTIGLNERLGRRLCASFAHQFAAANKLVRLRYNPTCNYNYVQQAEQEELEHRQVRSARDFPNGDLRAFRPVDSPERPASRRSTTPSQQPVKIKTTIQPPELVVFRDLSPDNEQKTNLNGSVAESLNPNLQRAMFTSTSMSSLQVMTSPGAELSGHNSSYNQQYRHSFSSLPVHQQQQQQHSNELPALDDEQIHGLLMSHLQPRKSTCSSINQSNLSLSVSSVSSLRSSLNRPINPDRWQSRREELKGSYRLAVELLVLDPSTTSAGSSQSRGGKLTTGDFGMSIQQRNHEIIARHNQQVAAAAGAQVVSSSSQMSTSSSSSTGGAHSLASVQQSSSSSSSSAAAAAQDHHNHHHNQNHNHNHNHNHFLVFRQPLSPMPSPGRSKSPFGGSISRSSKTKESMKNSYCLTPVRVLYANDQVQVVSEVRRTHSLSVKLKSLSSNDDLSKLSKVIRTANSQLHKDSEIWLLDELNKHHLNNHHHQFLHPLPTSATTATTSGGRNHHYSPGGHRINKQQVSRDSRSSTMDDKPLPTLIVQSIHVDVRRVIQKSFTSGKIRQLKDAQQVADKKKTKDNVAERKFAASQLFGRSSSSDAVTSDRQVEISTVDRRVKINHHQVHRVDGESPNLPLTCLRSHSFTPMSSPSANEHLTTKRPMSCRSSSPSYSAGNCRKDQQVNGEGEATDAGKGRHVHFNLSEEPATGASSEGQQQVQSRPQKRIWIDDLLFVSSTDPKLEFVMQQVASWLRHLTC